MAVATLASICATHVTGDVHFLKIDVEGGTRAVIEGMDFRSVRPWIVLVEATEPQSQVDVSSEWEGLFLANDYRLVYADGLNRFYLANERQELARRFKYPPNVFDDFIRASEYEAKTRLDAAEKRASDVSRIEELYSRSLSEQVERTRDAERRAHGTRVDAEQLRQALDTQLARNRRTEQRSYGTRRELEAERANTQRARALLHREAGTQLGGLGPPARAGAAPRGRVREPVVAADQSAPLAQGGRHGSKGWQRAAGAPRHHPGPIAADDLHRVHAHLP